MSPPTAPSPPRRARGAGTRRSPATPSAPAGPPEEPLSPRPRVPRTSPGPRGTPQSLQSPPQPLKVADRTPTGLLKGPFQPLGHPELSVPRRTPRIPTQHHGDTHGTSQNFTALPRDPPRTTPYLWPRSAEPRAAAPTLPWSGARYGAGHGDTERGSAIRSRTRSGARRYGAEHGAGHGAARGVVSHRVIFKSAPHHARGGARAHGRRGGATPGHAHSAYPMPSSVLLRPRPRSAQ